VLGLLERYESRNVTWIDPGGGWPVVWERARGVHVWDVEGKRYLDLTAAFGVAASGHANARVTRAAQKQLARLPHAMGDVHPHPLKAKLARELSRITFERWSADQRTGKTIFCNSGFEAVEAALKTALLATGRAGVIAFEGAYHGLGYGALNTTHRPHFRSHFQPQLAEFAVFVPFPAEPHSELLASVETRIRSCFRKGKIGAVLVEPIQARGGINVPPSGLLPLLRDLCDEYKALLVLDEIYTGFGRTGRWFACEHAKVIPDLICLGKALTNGFPLSACVGESALMDKAWPPSSGEAIHTSTFLGNPVGCAMALAQIEELRTKGLIQQSATTGAELKRMLRDLPGNIRGSGLLVGLELVTKDGKPDTRRSLHVIKAMLQRGFVLLPEGEFANVISFSPAFTISARQLRSAINALKSVLEEIPTSR